MGPTEAIIILLIVLVLFGPTLVAFFVGYSLGKKKAAPPVPSASPSTTDTDSGVSGPGEE